MKPKELKMFKYLPISIILSIYLSSTPLWSNDTISQQQASINLLIQEIKKASSDQKRVKMNELKILLRTMNQETRDQTMRNLQKSFANNASQYNSDITNHNTQQQGQTQVPRMQIHRQGQQGGGRR